MQSPLVLLARRRLTLALCCTAGQVVEQIGNLTGSDDWKVSGKKEAAEGDAEYNAAQAKGCEYPLIPPSHTTVRGYGQGLGLRPGCLVAKQVCLGTCHDCCQSQLSLWSLLTSANLQAAHLKVSAFGSVGFPHRVTSAAQLMYCAPLTNLPCMLADAEGTKDRVVGKKDDLLGKVTGNDERRGKHCSTAPSAA